MPVEQVKAERFGAVTDASKFLFEFGHVRAVCEPEVVVGVVSLVDVVLGICGPDG